MVQWRLEEETEAERIWSSQVGVSAAFCPYSAQYSMLLQQGMPFLGGKEIEDKENKKVLRNL